MKEMVLRADDAVSPRASRYSWGWASLLLLALLLATVDVPRDDARNDLPPVVLHIDGLTYHVPASEWRTLLEGLLSDFSESEQYALQQMISEVDQQIEGMLSLPRAQIAAAADWYFSVEGQAARLLMAGLDRFSSDGESGQRMLARMGEILFPEEEWSAAQTMLVHTLADSAVNQGTQVLDAVRTRLHRDLAPWSFAGDSSPMSTFAWDLEFAPGPLLEQLRQDPALGWQSAVVPTALVAGAAARMSAAGAAARAGARSATLRGASRGTAGLGSMACMGSGPFVGVCAATVFTGTLLAGEYALLRLDEALHREDFEQALHAELDRLEQAFRAEVQAVFVDELAASLLDRRQKITEQWRPVDHLLEAFSARRSRQEPVGSGLLD